MGHTVLIQRIYHPRPGSYLVRALRSDIEFEDRCRGIEGMVYQQSMGCWSIALGSLMLSRLKNEFGSRSLQWTRELDKGPASPVDAAVIPGSVVKDSVVTHTHKSLGKPLSAHWEETLHRILEHLTARRYSWRTVKSYVTHLRGFFAAHPQLA